MGWIRVTFLVAGRVMTALVAGVGFWFDYAGESVLSISRSNWGIIGLIAFGVFVLLTLIREIDLVLQQRPRIEVYSNSPAGMDLTLVVYNKSDTSANFSATMTCTFNYGELMEKVQMSGLRNASMYWESSGNANELINGHGRKILRLCSTKETALAGATLKVTHYMEFYKVESGILESVDCAHWSEGSRIPKVIVDVHLDSSVPIKGRRLWKYQVFYIEGNNMLGIYDLARSQSKSLIRKVLSLD